MTPSKPANLNKAADILERAHGELESIPGAGDSSLLTKVSGKLLDALGLLYEADQDLLSVEMRQRVKTRLEAEKPRSGRDTFNTGF